MHADTRRKAGAERTRCGSKSPPRWAGRARRRDRRLRPARRLRVAGRPRAAISRKAHARPRGARGARRESHESHLDLDFRQCGACHRKTNRKPRRLAVCARVPLDYSNRRDACPKRRCVGATKRRATDLRSDFQSTGRSELTQLVRQFPFLQQRLPARGESVDLGQQVAEPSA